MDTSDPDIAFNEDGTRNHCSDYIARIKPLFGDSKRNDEKVRNLIDHIKAKGKGKSYDSIIGISGGAVSYTHLDVYKRQLLPGAPSGGCRRQEMCGVRAGLRSRRHGVLPGLSRPDLLLMLLPRRALPRPL